VAGIDHRDPAAAFLDGLILFNQGRFFAAHEAWEIAWRQARGTKRILTQGLIQAAAALLHFERGNRRGARSVYAKACTRLERLPARMMGLDLDEFRQDLAAFFDNALVGSGSQSPPRLRLFEPSAGGFTSRGPAGCR
jgi:predicted metal-dependent hydrolase